jgi:hypothetical protein
MNSMVASLVMAYLVPAGMETTVRLKSANMASRAFNDRCRSLNTCRVYLKLLQVIFILCYSGAVKNTSGV